jgi:hypothetical protein
MLVASVFEDYRNIGVADKQEGEGDVQVDSVEDGL